jgi:hypothetical protein
MGGYLISWKYKKLAPRDGLLGASRLALRVAVAGLRRLPPLRGVVEPAFLLSAIRI